MHSSNYCDGTFIQGKCGGGAQRLCCQPRSSECSLIEFKSDRVFHYAGKDSVKVFIDPGFKSSMDLIHSFAEKCDVQLAVTSSFRLEGAVIDNEVVKPAQFSNHKVGHAIDMNIWYENGRQTCNSKCLVKPELPFWASCFIDEIRKEPSLRTGLDFPTKDPVHIDDNLYLNPDTSDYWMHLNATYQNNC